MIIKDPLNIKNLHTDEFIKTNLLQPVTSQFIYEPSSTRFHPEGLYSEEIFGQIGTSERISTIAYINMHSQVFVPIIFKNIKDLKSVYLEIMAGKTYAIYNTTTNMFDICSKETEGAETGYSFFMSHFDTLVFKETESNRSKLKISVIEKAKAEGSAITDKLLVLPAGIRDIKKKDGRDSEEDIGKLYRGIMSLASSLDYKGTITNKTILKMYDGIKYNLQLKFYEIYEYVKNMYSGKKGFGQAKYAGRSIAYGTRNVVTASTMAGTSPNESSYHKQDESKVPLFEACKMFQPIMIYYLKNIFFNNIFTYGTTQAAVIDPATLKQVYVEVDNATITKYMSNEYYEDLINEFQDTHMRLKPVTIKDVNGKDYYINSVYDLGDTIYMFKGIDTFKTSTNISPDIPSTSRLNGMKELINLGISPEDFLFTRESALRILNLLDEDNLTEANKEFSNFVSDNVITVFMSLETYKNTLGNEGYPRNYQAKIELGAYGILEITLLPDEEYTRYKNGARIIDGEYYLVSINHLLEICKLTERTPSQRSFPILQFMPECIHKLQALLDDGVYIDVTKIHPLTYLEMFYLAAMSGISDKHCTLTRYPAIEIGSIYPSKIQIGTTIPSRKVHYTTQYPSNLSIVLDNYPVLKTKKSNNSTGIVDNHATHIYQDSLIFHPSQAGGLGADYDGDALNAIGLMSEEANKECADHLASAASLITSTGTFLKSGVTSMTQLTIFNLTR